MSNVERKLVTFRQVSDIKPIEGADAIELAIVDSWQCVVKKGTFKQGDVAVYFEIDSFLPVEPRYEFLRKGCFKSTTFLGDGFRIRTIKLRGEISQGLLLPLSDFDFYKESEFTWKYTDSAGNQHYIDPLSDQDLSQILGVQKWEKPLPASLSGKAKGNFPPFITETDQERIQNIFGKREWLKHKDELFEVSLKLDGTSFTAYIKDGNLGVCSRNLELDIENNPGNTYVEFAIKSGLLESLRDQYVLFPDNTAIQGELMGPGIQDNRENLKEHKLFIFNVFDIDKQCYVDPLTANEYVNLWFHNEYIEYIPVIERSTSLENFKTIEDFLNYADRASLNHPIAEGVVFKSLESQFSFKVINNKFLTSEKD